MNHTLKYFLIFLLFSPLFIITFIFRREMYLRDLQNLPSYVSENAITFFSQENLSITQDHRWNSGNHSSNSFVSRILYNKATYTFSRLEKFIVPLNPKLYFASSSPLPNNPNQTEVLPFTLLPLVVFGIFRLLISKSRTLLYFLLSPLPYLITDRLVFLFLLPVIFFLLSFAALGFTSLNPKHQKPYLFTHLLYTSFILARFFLLKL